MCKKAKSLSKQLEKNAKIDYLLSEILDVLGVAGGALLIVEIFAGTICLGAVSAGLGIILGMTMLAVSMDDYCQTMRLYADACEDTPKGEAARQQLEKNAKIDTAWAIAGVVGAGAVKFTVNAVRRSGLGKKVGEEIATLFVKNGGDAVLAETKNLPASKVLELSDVHVTIKSGIKSHPLRQEYEQKVKDLSILRDNLFKQGKSEQEVAQTLNQARRDLGVEYKDATPEILREYIYYRNTNSYQDKLGPTYDFLKKSRSDTEIIESACRPNDNVDKLFIGFDDWYTDIYKP